MQDHRTNITDQGLVITEVETSPEQGRLVLRLHRAEAIETQAHTLVEVEDPMVSAALEAEHQPQAEAA